MASKKIYKNNNKSKLKIQKQKQINKTKGYKIFFNRLAPKQINTQKKLKTT
jgi:hypothetical protein